MFQTIRPALVCFATLTIITGVVYPAVVTAASKMFFPAQAEGSVIERGGKAVGSTLIAQPFTDARYFWPRPSAAGANGYDAASGSGSNLGPSNPALVDAVKGRINALRAADPGNAEAIPVDLVTASGSGLDPHESVAAARFQAARIAKARGMAVSEVQRLIDAQTEHPVIGVGGDARVNVLRLNLSLDAAAGSVVDRETK